MKQLATFLVLTGVMIVMTMFVQGALPEEDPFAHNSGSGKNFLEDIPEDWFAYLKHRHALDNGRYDIGLFGNSRTVNVGTSDISAGPCSFFNFSLPGQSQRASTAFLELLAKANKAPGIAFVAIDNFELQAFENAHLTVSMGRWKGAALDLWQGLMRPDVTAKQFIRMGYRILSTEGMVFRQFFEVEYFARGLRHFLGLSGGTYPKSTTPGRGYLSDGSRPNEGNTSPPDPTVNVNDLRHSRSQYLHGYLRYDLERFKAVEQFGTKVVLFESALAPIIADPLMDDPTQHVTSTRNVFQKGCEELKLTCYPAVRRLPFPEESFHGLNHPRSKSLGTYLGNLLKEQTKNCG